MPRGVWLAGVEVVALVMVGCAKTPSCSDGDSVKLVTSIVGDKAYEKLQSYRGWFGGPIVDDAIGRLHFGLDAIRTQSRSEDTRKVVCEAELTGDADGADSQMKAAIVYSLQEADDGDHLYAEITEGDWPGVMTGSINHALELAKQAQPPQPEAAAPAAPAPAPEAMSTAPASDGTYTEAASPITQLLPTDCDLYCATVHYQEADHDLNAAYKEVVAQLPEGRQAELKAEQRAWIQDKESKCAFPSEQAEMSCKAEMTLQRVAYVKSWR